MRGVIRSGTDVNEMVTVPANITFTITDDDYALELDEMYPLVIIPDDTTVTVENRLANIIIEDKVDSKSLSQFVNPRRACAARVTVVVLCVCVCVCVSAALICDSRN